jgi:hypothetical protein
MVFMYPYITVTCHGVTSIIIDIKEFYSRLNCNNNQVKQKFSSDEGGCFYMINLIVTFEVLNQ